ncbi:hypothetical protein TNCV_2305341 [Trichonephila clavipes]|nr:hypothetical protein TNCV_2305341 [Trichonephila clavipes]
MNTHRVEGLVHVKLVRSKSSRCPCVLGFIRGETENIRAPLTDFGPQAGTYKGLQNHNIRLWAPYNPAPIHDEGVTATAGSDVVQSGRPIFGDFFQHLWPYIGNNTANVVFQMVKRLWLIRIDQ